MPFKFTMMMNAPNGGFSETWYYDGTTNLPVAPGNPFDELAVQRAPCLAPQVTMIAWRLTDMANPRRSQLRLFPKGATSQPDTDVPTNSWLAMCRGEAFQGRRQLWFRGVADDAILWNPAGNRFSYSGGFKDAFDSYVQTLTGQGSLWSIQRVATKTEQAGNVFNVSSLLTPGGTSGTQLVNVNTLIYSQPIIVAGFRKPLGVLNGTYLPDSGYRPITGGIQLLRKSVPQYAIAGYPGGGTIRQRLTTLVHVKTIQLEFARERRIGRAFFELRGRR